MGIDFKSVILNAVYEYIRWIIPEIIHEFGLICMTDDHNESLGSVSSGGH